MSSLHETPPPSSNPLSLLRVATLFRHPCLAVALYISQFRPAFSRLALDISILQILLSPLCVPLRAFS